jgi:hypothetical protein
MLRNHNIPQEMLHKLSSTYGDGQLDVLDYLPLFAVLLAAALIFNSLIPASVFGRGEARKDDDVLGNILDNKFFDIFSIRVCG